MAIARSTFTLGRGDAYDERRECFLHRGCCRIVMLVASDPAPLGRSLDSPLRYLRAFVLPVLARSFHTRLRQWDGQPSSGEIAPATGTVRRLVRFRGISPFRLAVPKAYRRLPDDLLLRAVLPAVAAFHLVRSCRSSSMSGFDNGFPPICRRSRASRCICGSRGQFFAKSEDFLKRLPRVFSDTAAGIASAIDQVEIFLFLSGVSLQGSGR